MFELFGKQQNHTNLKFSSPIVSSILTISDTSRYIQQQWRWMARRLRLNYQGYVLTNTTVDPRTSLEISRSTEELEAIHHHRH